MAERIQTRFEMIRKVYKNLVDNGLDDVKERREMVIEKIAVKDLGQELPETKETAIHKFFELKIRSHKTRAIIQADHAVGYLGVRDMVEKISSKLEATSLIAKKPRSYVEVARKRGFGNNTKIRSTSARAAMWWAYDKAVTVLNWRDKDGTLKKPVYRLCLNGVDDKPGHEYDIVIAKDFKPADIEVLDKFRELVSEKMGSEYKIVLAGAGTNNARDNSGFKSISHFRYIPENDRDRHHPAFGENFQTFQVGIVKSLRENQVTRKLVIDALSYAMKEIQND